MTEQINMVLNFDYWDSVAKSKNFNLICHGFHTEEQFYNFIEPIEDLRMDMKFLDFGCGPGRIAKTVAPNVAEYVGVDVSGGFIAMAREYHKHYKNVSFFKCEATNLKILEDNIFDYIYERLVFIHIPKKWIVGYFPEFSRVLKPGALLNFPDFPRIENNTNGFTIDEVKMMMKDFDNVIIDATESTYKIKGVKRNV